MDTSPESHTSCEFHLLDQLGKEEADAMQELQRLRLQEAIPNAPEVSTIPIEDEGALILPPSPSPGNLPPFAEEPPSAPPPSSATQPARPHLEVASSGGSELPYQLLGPAGRESASEHPYETEPGDHAETPIEAYEHIAPLLTRLARRLDTTPEALRIYDPYYCEGRCAIVIVT